MLRRVLPGKKRAGAASAPVYLNVYDITPLNSYGYWFGLGVYHSGVQVHGVEYAFGSHENSWTGVFEVEPKRCPGFIFRKSILIGRTHMDSDQVCTFMGQISQKYAGNSYNLITRNCNHFCNEVCINLTGKAIPSWVNRLARLGVFCKCVLPATIKETRIRQGRIKGNVVVEQGMRNPKTSSTLVRDSKTDFTQNLERDEIEDSDLRKPHSNLSETDIQPAAQAEDLKNSRFSAQFRAEWKGLELS